MIKDFSLISDAGRAYGVPLLTTGLILELYRAAANAGLHDQDYFAVVKFQSEISTQYDTFRAAAVTCPSPSVRTDQL